MRRHPQKPGLRCSMSLSGQLLSNNVLRAGTKWNVKMNKIGIFNSRVQFQCFPFRACSARANSAGSSIDQVEIDAALHGPSRPFQDAILDEIHKKSCAVGDGITSIISGDGTQLGMDSTWRLSVSSCGAFREEIKTPKFTTICGYDGRESSSSWSGDHTGLAQYLEMDDHELTVMVGWVRSGLWASQGIRRRLSLSLFSKPGEKVLVLRMRLRGGRVNGMLEVDGQTMHPRRMVFDLRNDTEGLCFENWKDWKYEFGEEEFKCRYPETIHYESMSGNNVLKVTDIQGRTISDILLPSATLLQHEFMKPQSPLLASDSEFRHLPFELPAWVTNSGHVLIQASIDGEKASGYWLFDTGASGSVIDTAVAEEMNLKEFGSFKVKGMAGDLDGKFRQCDSFTVGSLHVQDLLMMEMDCSGIVRGGPGRIVGIIGCDVMSRAVFDIPQVFPKSEPLAGVGPTDILNPAAAMAISSLQDKRKKSRSIPRSPSGFKEIVITMSDPRQKLCLDDDAKWMKINWVSSLPHLKVKCPGHSGTKEVLLMIDSGAGGMQLMMNGLTASSLGLCVPGTGKPSTGTRTVRGVGGSNGSNIKLGTENLRYIQIGSEVVHDVDCLVASEGTRGGVELSHYTGGVLCNDILVRHRFVIDMPRDRMAIL